MSPLTDRASPVTEQFLIVLAISCTAKKSPRDEAGNPASIMSTPSLSSCLAIASFSRELRLTPGDCSPSRRVVSKTLILRNGDHRFLLFALFDKRHHFTKLSADLFNLMLVFTCIDRIETRTVHLVFHDPFFCECTVLNIR